MKRVLIINGSAIGEKTGTGITLENLWSDYPQSAVLQLLVNSIEVERDREFDTVLTPLEFCRFPYGLSKRKQKQSNPNQGKTPTLNANIAQSGLKLFVIDFIRGILDSWPVNYKSIDDKIVSFNPEVIYTCGASIRILKVALHYSKRFNIPIVLHLMDDWPSTIYTTSVLSVPFHKLIMKKLREAAKRSEGSFAISEALAKKNEKQLHVKMLPLMNPASKIRTEPNIRNKEDVRFIYAGSLSLNRWRSLLQIAEAIDHVSRDRYKTKFDLYVPDSAITESLSSQFKQFGASLHPYIPKAQLEKEYADCDVAVFTESFDQNVVDFIKLSLSTKIPEYMGSGNAILAYLPAELHSSDYLKSRDAGFVVNDPANLETVILDILEDNNGRLEKAKKALIVARSEHSQESAQKKLYAALQCREA